MGDSPEQFMTDLMPETETKTMTPVSEETPVRLGLILAIIGIVVIFIGAAWYLATVLSKIETRLDIIMSRQENTATIALNLDRKQGEHEREDQGKWSAIDTRLSIIERTGSEKTREIEKMLSELRNDFRVHEALSDPTRSGIKH